MTETYEKPVEGIEYYNLRLNEIKMIYLAEGREVLEKNKNKVKKLVEDYNQGFKGTEEYDSMLVESIEAFIL